MNTFKTSSDTLAQIAVIVAFVFTLVMNTLAVTLPLFGRSTKEISDSFPSFFTPAGYVFSIWSVLYLSQLAFTVYQALPAQASNPRIRAVRYRFDRAAQHGFDAWIAGLSDFCVQQARDWGHARFEQCRPLVGAFAVQSVLGLDYRGNRGKCCFALVKPELERLWHFRFGLGGNFGFDCRKFWRGVQPQQARCGLQHGFALGVWRNLRGAIHQQPHHCQPGLGGCVDFGGHRVESCARTFQADSSLRIQHQARVRHRACMGLSVTFCL
jgi:hypothetical protein